MGNFIVSIIDPIAAVLVQLPISRFVYSWPMRAESGLSESPGTLQALSRKRTAGHNGSQCMKIMRRLTC